MRNIATIFLLSIVIISNQLHASESYVELKDYSGQEQDLNTIQTKKELKKFIQEKLKKSQGPDYSWKESVKNIVYKILEKQNKKLEKKNEQSQQQLSSGKPAKKYDRNTSDEQPSCFPCKFCCYLSGDYC